MSSVSTTCTIILILYPAPLCPRVAWNSRVLVWQVHATMPRWAHRHSGFIITALSFALCMLDKNSALALCPRLDLDLSCFPLLVLFLFQDPAWDTMLCLAEFWGRKAPASSETWLSASAHILFHYCSHQLQGNWDGRIRVWGQTGLHTQQEEKKNCRGPWKTATWQTRPKNSTTG